MKRILSVVIVAVALTGCAGGKITPAETVLLGCNAYTSSLNQVATLREHGKLKDSHVAIVEGVRSTLNPLCLGQAPDVEASIKDVAVDAGVRSINAILAVVF